MASAWQCTNNEYHADLNKIGSTMLKTAIVSPAEYYGRYVAKTIPNEQTPAMTLGSAVHCLVLEPEKFSSLFCCRPEGIDGRTKEGKVVLAEFRLKSLGKLELTSDQKKQADAMAAAVLRHPLVHQICDDAIRERAIVWEEDGLEFKCKPDWFIERPDLERDLHLDLKTSDDPTPENWDSSSRWSPMVKYGYDLQVAAHYPIGIEAMTGRGCDSGLVVVGASEPHDVFLYDTTPWRAQGEDRRAQAIRSIRECSESGVWERPEQEIVTILSPKVWP